MTNKPKKAAEIRKDDKKWATIATVAVIAVFTIYGAVTILKDAKENKPPDEPSSAVTTTVNNNNDDNKNADPEETGPIDKFNRNNSIVTENPLNEGYNIEADSKIILTTTSGQNACYIYVPIAYAAKTSQSSVIIKPNTLDEKVTDHNPIVFSWTNVPRFEDIIENNSYDELERNYSRIYDKHLHTIVCEYDYIAHETTAARVYIIKTEKVTKPGITDIRNETYYRIVIDVKSKVGSRPVALIYEEDLNHLLSNRYTTIQELTRAMLKPIDDYGYTQEITTTTIPVGISDD